MILSTMKDSAISEEYVGQRVQEIIEENLTAERELYIQQLTHELSLCQSKLSKLEKVLEGFQSEREALQSLLEGERRRADSTSAYRSTDLLEEQVGKLQRELAEANVRFETLVSSTKSEAREISFRYRNECERLKQQVADANASLEESVRELDKLRSEYEEAQGLARRLKERVAELEGEHHLMLKDYKSLKNLTGGGERLAKELEYEESCRKLERAVRDSEREKAEMLDRLNAYNEEAKRSHEENIAKIMKEQKGQRQQLKKKVLELSNTIKSLESELMDHKRSTQDLKQSYEAKVAALNTEIVRLKEEAAQKIHESEMELQRRITEEQSKSAMEISQLHEEFQTKLDAKVAELMASAEEQLARAKSSQVEMASMLGERVESIEKTSVPLRKYEEDVQEERKKAKELIAKEKVSLKETHEKEIEVRLASAEANKELEIERLTSSFTQKISSLERDIAKHKESLKSMESEIMREKAKSEEMEEERNILIKDKKRLAKQCEEATNKANEFENELRSERQQYQEARSVLKSAKTDSLGLAERHDRLNASVSRMNAEVQTLKQKLLTAQEEKEKDARRVKSLQSENEELQSTIRKVMEEKTQLNGRLQRQISDLTSEIQSTHATTMQIRQKENDKYEKEVRSHTETKNNLIQSEYRLAELEEEVKELKEITKKNEELKLHLEDELRNVQHNAKEQQNRLKAGEKELKKTLQKLHEIAKAYKLFKDRVNDEVATYSSMLRGELRALKECIGDQIAELRKELSRKTKALLAMKGELERSFARKAESAISSETKQIREELQKKLVDTEDCHAKLSMSVAGKHGVAIKEKNAEIAQLKTACSELEERNKLLMKEFNSIQFNLKEYEEIEARLVSENEILKSQVHMNSEELSRLKSQTAKFKIDAESSVLAVKQELDEKHKQQLVALGKEIESLKQNSSQQLLEILDTIAALKIQYQHEVEQIIKNANSQLGEFEYLLKLERERAEQYKTEIEKLQEDIDLLKDSHRARVHEYEERVKSIGQNSDRYSKWKLEKNAEVDFLSKQLSNISEELEAKTKLLTELSNELEVKEIQIRELRRDLEEREARQRQRELEHTNVVFTKEKEIEDLQKLMSRLCDANRCSLHQSQPSFKQERKGSELARSAKKARALLKSQGDDLDISNARLSISQLSSPASKYS